MDSFLPLLSVFEILDDSILAFVGSSSISCGVVFAAISGTLDEL